MSRKAPNKIAWSASMFHKCLLCLLHTDCCSCHSSRACAYVPQPLTEYFLCRGEEGGSGLTHIFSKATIVHGDFAKSIHDVLVRMRDGVLSRNVDLGELDWPEQGPVKKIGDKHLLAPNTEGQLMGKLLEQIRGLSENGHLLIGLISGNFGLGGSKKRPRHVFVFVTKCRIDKDGNANGYMSVKFFVPGKEYDGVVVLKLTDVTDQMLALRMIWNVPVQNLGASDDMERERSAFEIATLRDDGTCDMVTCKLPACMAKAAEAAEAIVSGGGGKSGKAAGEGKAGGKAGDKACGEGKAGDKATGEVKPGKKRKTSGKPGSEAAGEGGGGYGGGKAEGETDAKKTRVKEDANVRGTTRRPQLKIHSDSEEDTSTKEVEDMEKSAAARRAKRESQVIPRASDEDESSDDGFDTFGGTFSTMESFKTGPQYEAILEKQKASLNELVRKHNEVLKNTRRLQADMQEMRKVIKRLQAFHEDVKFSVDYVGKQFLSKVCKSGKAKSSSSSSSSESEEEDNDDDNDDDNDELAGAGKRVRSSAHDEEEGGAKTKKKGKYVQDSGDNEEE